MNRRQQAVLIAALILLVVMLLFPPWYHSMEAGGREIRFYQGYRYISAPSSSFSRIDIPSLLWPIGAVCLMALLAFLELRDGT
jgi:hypothetical protein